MTKVLIVEDDTSIVKMLSYDLKMLQVDIDVAYDGERGLSHALNHPYDIIILDVMLPKINGFEICKKIREAKNEAHVIMLTAMDEEYNLIDGFEVGADDYVTKPFSPRELTARIKAVIRRKASKDQKQLLSYHDISVDTQAYEVYKGDQKIGLTLKEFELLEFLIRHKGQALSREQLLSQIWGYSYDGDTRVVDVHIFKLREKLAFNQENIKTIRGVGYKLI